MAQHEEKKRPENAEQKSSSEVQHHGQVARPDDKKFDTALAWLVVGGALGLHLLYLKKTRQAVVYACTGGFFLLGVLYDMWTLDVYVSDANFDEQFVERYKRRKEASKTSIFRNVVEVTFGLLLGYIAYFALPTDWQDSEKTKLQDYLLARFNALVISPIAVGFGVWFAGGIGTQRLDLSASCCGALFTIPCLIYQGNVSGLFYTALSADFWASYRSRTERSLAKLLDECDAPYKSHMGNYVLFVSLFYTIAIAAAVNNGAVKIDAGDMPLRDFLWHAPRTMDYSHAVNEFEKAIGNLDFARALKVLVNGGNSVVDTVIFSQILGMNLEKVTMTQIHHACSQLLDRRDAEQQQSISADQRISKMMEACQKLFNRYEANAVANSDLYKMNHHEQAESPNEKVKVYQGEKFMKFDL